MMKHDWAKDGASSAILKKLRSKSINDALKWKYIDKTRDTLCLKTYTHRLSYMFHIKARQRQIWATK